MSGEARVQVLDPGAELPLVEGEGSARVLVGPATGATMRSFHRISLGAGARTVVQRHPMEAVYFVIAGEASAVDPDDGSSQALVEGSFVHVDAGTAYRFEAGSAGAELVGGPCPPDPALYAGPGGGA